MAYEISGGDMHSGEIKKMLAVAEAEKREALEARKKITQERNKDRYSWDSKGDFLTPDQLETLKAQGSLPMHYLNRLAQEMARIALGDFQVKNALISGDLGVLLSSVRGSTTASKQMSELVALISEGQAKKFFGDALAYEDEYGRKYMDRISS